jgi:hypothetical protein
LKKEKNDDEIDKNHVEKRKKRARIGAITCRFVLLSHSLQIEVLWSIATQKLTQATTPAALNRVRTATVLAIAWQSQAQNHATFWPAE